MGCKGGCSKCNPWYSDKCTECFDDYLQGNILSYNKP